MTTTTEHYASTAQLTPEDKSLIYRVVGFVEYGTSLRNLDEFINRATQEELQAANEWVAQRPEFTIYTNLSRRIQSAQSTLGPQKKDDRRTGLPWVTALARVELGGMLATFSSHDSPYELVGPTEYDMPAYRELLLDASQTHVWALVNDRDLDRAAKGVPDTMMLAYLRRVGLVRLLLSAAARSNADSLSRAQFQEMIAQDTQVKNQQDRFAATITAYLQAMNATSTSTQANVSERSFVQKCLESCSRPVRNEARIQVIGRSTGRAFAPR